MKIEKINDNKVRITLTFEELEKREISLSQIEKDNNIAKDFFINLIEESNLEEDFEIDNSQLFIEASSDNNNLFVITITKIEDIPELRHYSLMDNSKTKIKRKKQKCKNDIIKYKVDSNMFSFNSIDTIIDLCEISKKEKLFFGRNSLYKYEDMYFLIFNKTSIKNDKFLKTYVFLSEFCENYYSTDLFETLLKEKSKLIIKDYALQKLSKL